MQVTIKEIKPFCIVTQINAFMLQVFFISPPQKSYILLLDNNGRWKGLLIY